MTVDGTQLRKRRDDDIESKLRSKVNTVFLDSQLTRGKSIGHVQLVQDLAHESGIQARGQVNEDEEEKEEESEGSEVDVDDIAVGIPNQQYLMNDQTKNEGAAKKPNHQFAQKTKVKSEDLKEMPEP